MGRTITEFRTEKDMLGEKQVPAAAYWGIHTERARENFRLSSYRVPQSLLRALAMVKKAACRANAELGYLDENKAGAIERACSEIIEGKLLDQFPVDALQGGAGTSTNMNVNEVVANRAIELRGGEKGEYSLVHPLEDVNLHQSTNDVYPTALRIAAICGVRELSRSAAALQGAFQDRERAFADIVAIGRTELQEAVPMTLGAEFSAFAEALSRDRWRTFKCEERLRVVNIGGTAVGTGLGAPKSYIFLVIEKLREVTGLGLTRGDNSVDQTANADAFVEVSGILKAHAASLIKIANDLRLLNLLGEIRLPQAQAGSSIMPGKVNPVLPEAAMQAALKVMANDATVAECAARGSLQIVEFMPLLAFALLESLDLLSAADAMLARHIRGIEADEETCRRHVDNSRTLVTAFVPRIGYDRAAALSKEYRESGTKTDIKEFLITKLGKTEVEKVLSPHKLTQLGYTEDEENT